MVMVLVGRQEHATYNASDIDENAARRTNVPMVGTVDNTSPMCNLYKMVVFPAASRPEGNDRISVDRNSRGVGKYNDGVVKWLQKPGHRLLDFQK